MQERSVIERIQVLEQNVAALEELPARVSAVELQIVQLRDEMRVEFSATRGELRGEMRAMQEGLRGEISAVHQELVALITHTTEETRRGMRVLHEDLKSTIKTLGETGR